MPKKLPWVGGTSYGARGSLNHQRKGIRWRRTETHESNAGLVRDPTNNDMPDEAWGLVPAFAQQLLDMPVDGHTVP